MAFALLLLSSCFCLAQAKSELSAPPPLDPAEGEKVARALVAHLLEERPEQPATNSGVLRISDSQRRQQEVRAQFIVLPTPTNWLNIYQATFGPNSPVTTLTIVHRGEQPNEYFVSGPVSGGSSTNQRKLAPEELALPFAGSDFCALDLGLDFLHWPQQRVLRKQMRKGLSCDELQSINPQPFKGGYSRVLSWIAVNRPDDIVIVHAEAYDLQDQLLKQFDPKKVEKVNGLWQLEEMEIRNRQTGTRTVVKFNLDEP